ncbi:MAG: fibronectin type III domain-containing protein [Armatimonadetes bacterium]|nr:fibronectin type III domain-containing protein [Armatimonadota bacterium]
MADSNSYLANITADPALVSALGVVLPLISTNKVALSMTTQEVTDLTNLCNAYTTQYQVANTAKATAKAAVTLKDTNKRNARKALINWTKVWRSNNAISDSLLELLMCPAHGVQPSFTTPTIPTNLVAFSDGQGNIELRWNRGTNIRGTSFFIETRDSPTSDFRVLGVTTTAKFVTEATPGQYISYRVIAARHGKFSPPTAPVSLWDNGQTGAFSVAA